MDDFEKRRQELLKKVKADLEIMEQRLRETQISIHMMRGALEALTLLAPKSVNEANQSKEEN